MYLVLDSGSASLGQLHNHWAGTPSPHFYTVKVAEFSSCFRSVTGYENKIIQIFLRLDVIFVKFIMMKTLLFALF